MIALRRYSAVWAAGEAVTGFDVRVGGDRGNSGDATKCHEGAVEVHLPWSALRRQTAIQATRWRQSGGRQTRSLKPNGIPGVCGHDRRIGETLDSRLFNLGGERSSG